ncbi:MULTISPECIES: hypothetical protein [unclassified Paenibacillus]|uniref:hypothetical protein n=1 Tax=unclassified Paenibacillus TaxID=185978 RepID=UPI001C1013F7|nr:MULTISPECIES: hypothetical protein [unclassified Paenibacillus]MBU5444036.1 hypothetical protein [Paenibacillus sp. MSJ-34]
MEIQMNAEDVLTRIKQLHANGETLSKKSVKKSYPDLMQNALYYYPSWEHALQKTGIR